MISLICKIALLLWGLVSLLSCISFSDTVASPPGYDLTNPEKFLMPSSLVEISGICFYNGNCDTVYAIQDEAGKLFRLAWQDKKQQHTKFGKSGDYEDLGTLGEQVIVLKSNGDLYSFSIATARWENTTDVQEWKDVLPQGEYEGLYADSTTGNVYVLCKNCPADNSKQSVTGFILSGTDLTKQVGRFVIDVTAIKAITGKVKRGFRPSGLAYNSITKEWFIISSVNKLLVVTDGQWKVKAVYPLSGNTFNQPEGITFDAEGNLYISNEGDDMASGNILKFVRL